MLLLNLNGTLALLDTLPTALRAGTPGFPLIPLCMNWAMKKEATAFLLVCPRIRRASDATMIHFHCDLTITKLLAISAGCGTVTPSSPLGQLAVHRTSLVIAITLVFQLLIGFARLPGQRKICLAIRSAVLRRNFKCTLGDNSTTSTSHTAISLLPWIWNAVDRARESVAIHPLGKLLRARLSTKLVLNLHIPLHLLRATAT
jgi:hypothetical protein